MPARFRRPCGLCRGTTGTRLGRVHRSLHHRGQNDHPPATRQARRPASHPHRSRGWLPDRRQVMQLRQKVLSLFHPGRPVLRVQLTLLYSGLFVGLLAAVLLATGVLFGGNQWRIPFRVFSSQQAPAGASAQQTEPAHQFVVGPALGAIVAVVVALLVAWWLAGRFLRPLRAITTTAREISATNLHRRLGLNGPDDELSELGRTLDD